MEDLVIKLLEQAPSTAAVIITVVLFLRQQKAQSAEWHKHNKIANDVARECRDDCTKAVKDNTKILAKVASLIETRIQQSGG